MKAKIDCHTHIVNKDICDEYFSRTRGYALVMEFLEAFTGAGLFDDSWKTVKGDRRLFLCPCVDLRREIPPQLEQIEARMGEVPVVGIKVYLTYQTGRADDPKMMPIYEFCRKHRLTVTYHTGSCALTLPSDNDLAGSDAKYVANVAELYPDVNFVVAHMDDPRYMACIRILKDHPNMYTDFCGAYEPGTKEGSDMEWAIHTFAEAIHQVPGMYRQILYGTDFCPPINLSAIEEYDYTIARIFEPEQLEDIYRNNCLRAFPKLADYLNEIEKEVSANV